MLSVLLRGIIDFFVILRGFYYFTYILRVFFEFGYRLFLFVTKGNKDVVICDMVNEESFLVLSSNLVFFYNLIGFEDFWKEFYDVFIKEGMYGFGVVLILKKSICRLCGK